MSTNDRGTPQTSADRIVPNRLNSLVVALRPRQWPKNLLVFLAPAAAGALRHGTVTLRALAVFGIFCLAASAGYLINDSIDIHADRLHPVKRNRPIASGGVDRPLAVVLGLVLYAVALAVSWALSGGVLALTMGVYSLITVAYSLRLKREPVIELVAVASGFVIRAIAGGVATGVPLSSWFLVVISFGALFVVTGKRSAELKEPMVDGASHRLVLSQYTSSFIQSILTLAATVTVTGYCLWAFERTGVSAHIGANHVWFELSVIPVVLGVLHVFRVLDGGKGAAPEDLLFHDHLLQVIGLIWVACFAIAIYA